MAKRRRKTSSKDKKWIQKAIKRPGSLRRWAKKHRQEIKEVTGEDPFTKEGKLNKRVLRKLKNNNEALRKISGSHWKKMKKKIVMAITLKSFNK